MSMQAMQSFLQKAQTEPAVGEQLVSIIDENPPEVIYPKVVTLAGSHGFDVTEADVKETHQEFKQAAAASEDGDLSDEDLENVSGGIAPVVVAAMIGVGAAGVGAVGTVAAAGVGGAAGITSAVISRGINNTVNDIGKFFSKW
jgi:predicted ribosomally synthesized peptide with nif11-like leader